MTALIYILIGFVVGIFVPAPYEIIARTFFSSVWATVKGWFTRSDG